MSDLPKILLSAAACCSLGMWLMLPRRSRRGRALGVVLASVGAGLFAFGVARASRVSFAEHAVEAGLFYLLAGIAVAAAAAAVTARNPVYSAIWFALCLLGTAGLFLYQGAQFLGVATVVVYAGAILVTFLFVLMLAQPEGRASYDRLSREAFLSSLAGGLMVGVVTLVTAGALADAAAGGGDAPMHAAPRQADGVLAAEHMARLGGELFGGRLVAVEIAGTLLLAALVGCIAMVAQIKWSSPGGNEPAERNGVR